MNTFHLKSRNLNCPTCDSNLDAAASGESFRKPSKGDLSICLYCGTLLEFDGEDEESLHYRQMSDENLELLAQEQPETHDQLLRFKTIIDDHIKQMKQNT